jgi:tripartite ATP-independent transporter DctM subunit
VDQVTATLVFLAILFLLLGLGVWIGLALTGVAAIGLLMFTTRPIGDALMTVVWTSMSSWSLTALPLFIWMGEILFRTRLSEDMFKGLAPLLQGLPGRLLHTNIAGCTLFAAVSGSSAATVATIGKMSIPELRRRGYPEHMVIGTLAGAGTLGLMIPPSLAFIVYGVTVNESLTKLFIAGVLPGLVLASLFAGYVAVWALLKPGTIPSEPHKPWSERLAAARTLMPIIALIIVIMGSMYTGYATATEAAAVGVIGALILAATQGALTWKSFVESLMSATRTSAMIALILAGAQCLSLTMGFTGLPRALAEFMSTFELSPTMLILALMVFYIVLGCFLDGISCIVLTMAVVEPMVRQAGIDMIWFGVFVTVVIEMAQITPPVGFNLFVLQAMTGREITVIARAALPMFAMMVVMVMLLIAFPGLATWLPETMSNVPG